MGQTSYGNRPQCLRCARPKVRCICQAVPEVQNRTPVWVLQHPRERTHPFGTVAMMRLGLTRLQVDVCWHVAASASVTAQLEAAVAAAPSPDAPAPPPLGLLFPSAHAQALDGLPAPSRPERLLVLDGTWSTVRALFRQNPVLAKLPHYQIAPDRLDRYKIRREPKAHYTSTLEATIAALRALEPENTAALVGLLDAFSTMIEGQLTLRQGRRVSRRRVRHRATPSVTGP